MQENGKMEMLSDAFNVFKDASLRLEQQYSLLEDKIAALNEEIAEKNRAMERTRRLAAMGEMAAKIAHEIRNPLGSMAIYATLLERDLTADPEKKRLAESISKGVKTLDNLLTNMLLFTSSPGARLKPVDIRQVMEETVSLVHGHEKKGVNIRIRSEGETLFMADEGLLKQMFLNLFLNSIDALGEGGEISVKTGVSKDSPQMMVIEVRDNGCGIPDEYLDRIFDPFFSTKERGTGLGLAIVSAVVAAHNGYIDVSSEEDKGATFLISLPVAGIPGNVC